MAKPLALTSGEPAGVGPDIAIEAWLRRSEASLPPFYLLGDRAFFADRARHIGLKADFAEVGVEEAASAAEVLMIKQPAGVSLLVKQVATAVK